MQIPPPPVEVTEKVTPADRKPDTANAGQAANAIGELQGTWSVVRTIHGGGKSVDSTYEYYRWKFDMAAGTVLTEWKKKSGESHTSTNRFTHNPETAPKQLTTYGDQGLLQAIYEFRDKTLRIGIFGIAEQERPGSFKTLRSEKADPLVVFELQRVPEDAAEEN